MFHRFLILVLALFAIVASGTAQVQVTTQQRWAQGGLPYAGNCEFSPDGKLLAHRIGNVVTVFSGDGAFVTTFRLPGDRPSPPSFSLDSKNIYTHVGKGVIGCFDARTGKRLTDLMTATNNVFGQALSPDGTRIAVCEGPNGSNSATSLKIYQLSDMKVVFTRDNIGDVFPAWSPDSKYLVVGIVGFQTIPGNYKEVGEYNLKPGEGKHNRFPFFSNTEFLGFNTDHAIVFINAATKDWVADDVPLSVRQNITGVVPSYTASPDKKFAYLPILVRVGTGPTQAMLLIVNRSIPAPDVKRYQIVDTGIATPTPNGSIEINGTAVNPINGDIWVPVTVNSIATRIALIKNTKDGHVFDRYVANREVSPSFVTTGQRGSARMVATVAASTIPNYAGMEVHNADNGNFLFRANVQKGATEGVQLANFSPNGEFLAVCGTEIDKDSKGTDGAFIYATGTGAKVGGIKGSFSSALFVSNTRLLVTNDLTHLTDEYTISATGEATFKASADFNGNSFWASDASRGRTLMLGTAPSFVANTTDLTIVSRFDGRAPFVSGTFAFDGTLITASRTNSPNNITIDKWNISGKTPVRVGASLVFPFISEAYCQVMAAPNGDWFVQTSNENLTFGGPYVHRVIRASDLKVITVDENPPIKEGRNFFAISPAGGTYFGAVYSSPLYALAVPPIVQSLTVAPSAVAGGTSATGTVQISTFPAGSGTTVTLSSNNAAAIVPPSLLLTTSDSGTFQIKTTAVAAPTVVRITATVNGISKFADLTIAPPTLTTLTLSPTTVIGGKPSVGTVSFTGPVSIDTVVDLKSDVVAANVPANVTIPAGQSSATFNIATKPVAAKTVASISAASGGITKKADLTINMPQVNVLTLVTPSVVGGGTVEAMLTLDGPAPAGGLPLAFVSSDSAVVGSSLTVPAGETSLSFSVDSNPILVDKTVSLNINGSSTLPISVTVQAPRLVGVMGKPESIRAGGSAELSVLLNGASPAALKVGTSTTAGLTASTTTVTVPTGATTFTLKITAKKPRANLFEKVTLELNGRKLTFDLRVTP